VRRERTGLRCRAIATKLRAPRLKRGSTTSSAASRASKSPLWGSGSRTGGINSAGQTGEPNGGQRSTTLETGARTAAECGPDLGKCWWAILGSNQ